jgi:hypothetical protein
MLAEHCQPAIGPIGIIRVLVKPVEHFSPDDLLRSDQCSAHAEGFEESSSHTSADMVLDRFPKAATVVHIDALPLALFGDRMLGIEFRQGLLDISRREPRSTIMLGANRLADQVRQFHASRAQRADPSNVARIKPNIQPSLESRGLEKITGPFCLATEHPHPLSKSLSTIRVPTFGDALSLATASNENARQKRLRRAAKPRLKRLPLITAVTSSVLYTTRAPAAGPTH